MTTMTMTREWKRTTTTSRRGAALLCALMLGTTLCAAAAPLSGSGAPAMGEQTKVPKLRTIEGMVCTKSGAPVHGAVVYLQDSRSLAVRSYLSDADGKYHFRELSMSLDYNLWAEQNGKRSKTKTISQFNSQPDLDYKLELPD